MKKNNSKNGEDIFKDKLANFNPPPPNSNWQKIASQLQGEELDAFVKNNLNEIESTPNPKIWANIKRKLPLSLLVRNQLNWLSGIAAGLTIFMVAILFFGKKEKTVENSEVVAINVDDEKIIEDANLDFVFTIDNNDKKENSASEELSLEDEKTLEDFWSSMDEKEDFIADVNQEIIEKSLEPILQLPIENLKAALPSNNRTAKKTPSFSQKNRITTPNRGMVTDEK